MTCRYEKNRLKEKRIEKIYKISGRKSQEDMIKRKKKSKKYKKAIMRKIFSIRLKSTPTIIKRESSQGGETPQNPLW